jgi:DNA helicase-2/ATP-dependent DNA helicase PcrA
MEEALRSLNIKYKVIGGLSFYQRKEIKDLISYLRFTVNPQDEEAFKRIVNYPKRGIGGTTIDKLVLAAANNHTTLWEVISDAEMYMGKGRTSAAITEFAEMIKAFQLAVKTKDAFTAATQIAKNSGILKELYEDKTVEGRMRYDNLQELLNSVKAFVDAPDREDKSLPAFLQEVALYTSTDDDQGEDTVTLMTIHMSKGLEFDYVYIVGVEEDLFPSQLMLSSREDLEEERRLFYVAITRAKTKLTVSYAMQRYRFGQLKPCEASRFIDEIDPQFLNTSKTISATSQQSFQFGYVRKTEKPAASTPVSKAERMPEKAHKVSENFKPSPTNALEEGMRVEHPKFGYGIIKAIEMYGADRRARIFFDQAGEKTLILSFAKLMII